MKPYTVKFFTITTKAPLHAGSGGENYWIIDNLIQRDPATNMPCIFSSTVKGALREFYKVYLEGKEGGGLKTLYSTFGRDKTDSDSDEDAKETEKLGKGKDPAWPGVMRVLQADLLSIPLVDSNAVTKQTTCPWLIEHFKEQLEFYGVAENSSNTFDSEISEIENAVFCEQVDDYNLPVIARNHITDGVSDNLWYEQILPRGTRLFFGIICQNTIENNALLDSLSEAITSYPVQFGANASIGYGFSKINLITTTELKK